VETRRYRKGAELDALVYEHLIDGVPEDFTSPDWTSFVMGCAPYATEVPITTGGFPKSTGITGLVDGIQVDWSGSTGAELDSLTPGLYLLQLRALRADGRHLDLAPVLLDLEPSLISP
jgi:hypothetical protein